MTGNRYHTFLSHNSDDKPAVEELAHRLREEGIEPWLDKWNLVPGKAWQPAIERALDDCDTCTVFIGPSGFGPWQNEEMRAAIGQRVSRTDGRFRVIPVVLPGGKRDERSRLPTFLTATTWVEFRKSLDEKDAFHRLVCGIRGIKPGPGPGSIDEGICPYRGLQAFLTEHARFFFGCEALTEWLLDELRTAPGSGAENRFLAIIGASGSGKSSLARAGLVPALKRGELDGSRDWPVVVLRPGQQPLESLAVALAAEPVIGRQSSPKQLMSDLAADERTLHLTTRLALHGAPETRRVVVLVDQFEEIFTLCDDDALRRALIDNLLRAAHVAGGRTVVVLTMRADFYGKCAGYDALAAALSDHQVLVGPMSDEELRRAIEGPAQIVGCELEAGLTEILIRDVADQAGALPLLQHALAQLWERRDARRITVAAYKEIGKIEGALNAHADNLYDDVLQTDDERHACRRVLLMLTTPGEGTEDTRRRVNRAQLGSDEIVESVLQALAKGRLVTIGETEPVQVEVAHEALIRGWHKLREWLDEDRDSLRILHRLVDVADEWQSNDREPAILYRGSRLSQAQEWSQQHHNELSDLQLATAFLNESIAQRERENARRKRFIRVITAALVLVSIAALVAIYGFRAASSALDDVNRLSDIQELRLLEDRAEHLWPAIPENDGDFKAWIDDAKQLANELDAHRQRLTNLRAQADSVPSSLDGQDGSGKWNFGDSVQQWQHDNLAELVDGLRRFVDSDGLIVQVLQRHRFAQTVYDETITKPRANWQEATADIADSQANPHYRGLLIQPQLGLIPLGRSRHSGLWEFAHLQTGAVPTGIDADKETKVEADTGIVFVLLPGGDFVIGSKGTPEEEYVDTLMTARPAHEVTLEPFFISKYEMTQGQWLRAHRENPSLYKPASSKQFVVTLNHPVEGITWFDCQTVLIRLGLRLPTEAQWEYAARAGTDSLWAWGNDKLAVRGNANISDKSYEKHFGKPQWAALEEWLDDGFAIHAPVGSFAPNRFGLFDMAGNIFEWCRDRYDPVAYRSTPPREKDGFRRPPATVLLRVSRGGSFAHDAEKTLCSIRFGDPPLSRFFMQGVRPVMRLER